MPVTHTAARRADSPESVTDPLFPSYTSGPLTVALALSLVFHSVALLITFQFPDAVNLRHAPAPIQVVLVNSQSLSPPLNPDAVAQANLDGGGNTEANRRAQTNLPALPDMPLDVELSLASKRQRELEIESHRLLAQINAGSDAVDPKTLPTEKIVPSNAPNAANLPQDRLAIARLEAAITMEWDAYQKLPKRKFVGARTQSAVEAEYLDAWRQRIENVGTANFPDEARQQGVFGTVMVTVAIRADGTVEKVEIDRSSGSLILDASVERIVQLAGPFRAFPVELRNEMDVLHVTRNWAFTRSDLLLTTE